MEKKYTQSEALLRIDCSNSLGLRVSLFTNRGEKDSRNLIRTIKFLLHKALTLRLYESFKLNPESANIQR